MRRPRQPQAPLCAEAGWVPVGLRTIAASHPRPLISAIRSQNQEARRWSSLRAVRIAVPRFFLGYQANLIDDGGAERSEVGYPRCRFHTVVLYVFDSALCSRTAA